MLFSGYMTTRGFSGQLKFDHTEGILDIMVSLEGNKKGTQNTKVKKKKKKIFFFFPF